MTNIGENRAPIFTRMQMEEEARAEPRRFLKNDKRPSEAGMDIDSGSIAEKPADQLAPARRASFLKT